MNLGKLEGGVLCMLRYNNKNMNLSKIGDQ